MGKESRIDYVDASWSPWYGCHKVSTGCLNCYAEREMKKYGRIHSMVTRSKTTFCDPLKWKEPKKIFVCQWSDFFIHEADPWRIEALEVMAACPQHTFIVVTKRPERIIECLYGETGKWYLGGGDFMPNIWFLATTENQETFDLRVPELLRLREKSQSWPVLGISVEPMLTKINISRHIPYPIALSDTWKYQLDWVVCGCESGNIYRPTDINWVRDLSKQCFEENIPFFLKQLRVDGKLVKMPELDGFTWDFMPEVK